MLDRDVMLLQIAATLIDSNEFLVHLLNRFNLMNWARDDYELKYLRVSSPSQSVVFELLFVSQPKIRPVLKTSLFQTRDRVPHQLVSYIRG